jgi:hypothetical protein
MNISKSRNEIKWTLTAAVICGVLTHGYMLFNKISYHDDIFCLYSLGGTYGSGRWSLGILGALVRRLLGGTYSAPALNGIFSILLIAVAATLIVLLFRIRDILWIVAVACIMETFPVVTATFSYMFTAPYYMLALVLAVLAAYLMSLHKKWLDGYGIGAVLSIAVAVGIYQAYFGVTVALVLAWLVWDYEELTGVQGKKSPASRVILTGIWNVAVMALGLVLYALLNKLFLAITNYELSDYRGVNNMFAVTPSGLLKSVAGAYVSFVQMFTGDYAGLTSVLPIRLALLLLWLAAAWFLVVSTIRHQKDMLCRVLYWVMILLLPLAIHIVNVMVSGGDTEVHTLMLYSLAVMFIFPIAVIAKNTSGCAVSCERTACGKVFAIAGKVLAAVLVLAYAVVDNQAYMRVGLLQNEATAFYNRLITRIESTDGYSQSDGIYIAGALEISDGNLTEVPQFPAVSMTGYTMTSAEFINDYAWKEYVRWQLGFDPVYETQLPDTAVLDEMGCYPDADSIRIVDDVVIVKFSDGDTTGGIGQE